MTQLVALVHPLTGKTIHLHPDIAAQKHRWIHPDPSVPTPPESLPLFELTELDKLIVSLADLTSSEWGGEAGQRIVTTPIVAHRLASEETSRVTRHELHSTTEDRRVDHAAKIG